MARIHAAALAFVALSCCSAALAQVQRTFVASSGNDANTATNCGFAAPCRSFAAAQTATESGGEIIALDSAGYGHISITKSLSILANPGAYAGISVSSSSAIFIGTAGVHVRLSGLKLNGIGGTFGVVMIDGDSLLVEDCTITGFNSFGIAVSAPAKVRILNSLVTRIGIDGIIIEGGATADVANTTMVGNARAGLVAYGSGTLLTTVAVTNSVSSGNQYGFWSYAPGASSKTTLAVSGSSADHNSGGGFQSQVSGAGESAVIAVSSSKAMGNGSGFVNIGGTFNSAGNNMVTGNGLNSSGVITPIGNM